MKLSLFLLCLAPTFSFAGHSQSALNQIELFSSQTCEWPVSGTEHNLHSSLEKFLGIKDRVMEILELGSPDAFSHLGELRVRGRPVTADQLRAIQGRGVFASKENMRLYIQSYANLVDSFVRAVEAARDDIRLRRELLVFGKEEIYLNEIPAFGGLQRLVRRSVRDQLDSEGWFELFQSKREVLRRLLAI